MRLTIAFLMLLAVSIGSAAAAGTDEGAAPAQGWLEQITAQIENEVTADVAMAPSIPAAVAREWRSLDSAGSAIGVVADLAWVTAAALIALLAEAGTTRVLSRRPRRRIGLRAGGARLIDVLALMACDVAGIVVFVAVLAIARRHVLPLLGITTALAVLALNVLIRWRIVSLILRVILRPGLPEARLVDLGDAEASHLTRFVSLAVLVLIVLVGFGRYGLMGAGSGAAHVNGLIIALVVCGINALIIVHARRAGEALIRGRRGGGVMTAIRAGVARAWVPAGLALVAGVFVCFVAGLSLGLLVYYYAMTSTLGVLFVLLVLDRLTEWEWRDVAPGAYVALGARAAARMLRAFTLVIGAILLARIWTHALHMSQAGAASAMRSAMAAVGTLFVAFLIWELVRLAIDRHLEGSGGGPSRPGDDDAAGPASRLQTILPLLRAAFAVAIAVVAVLIVLSRLGVDTAPLIAGAGVFGLAVSFGSQSLVRDIISGLFYMWDDAFRVGEYIDAGRLKGTVETLGIRSVKLRHQNGPLHTIPYGQLGAVTNLSRDFATIKFNLRLEPGTDVELVRRTAKQIGLAMQENEEMAAEVMLPLKLQGIAEVVDTALVLRFKFTVRPVKPSWVQREYLKRIYQVFAEKGIRFASGALTLQTVPAPVELPAPVARAELPAAQGMTAGAAAGAVELPAVVVPSPAG